MIALAGSTLPIKLFHLLNSLRMMFLLSQGDVSLKLGRVRSDLHKLFLPDSRIDLCSQSVLGQHARISKQILAF